MDQQVLLGLLAEKRAIITGSHVVYTSGKHGADYVNKDAIFPHTIETSLLCRVLAEEFRSDGVDVVVGPVVGGVILSNRIAGFLTQLTDTDVLGVYADKVGEHEFVLKRGYDKLVHSKRVLVVEDVLTTGGSVRSVVDVVRAAGGEVVGVGALCNRGGVTAVDIGDVPKLVALMNVTLDAWDEAECPFCALGVPINTDVGKGSEFLARNRG